MHTKIFLSIFLIFSYLTGWSQIQISGTLTDQSTKLPIPFANVFIAETEIGTVSDEKGNYLLQNVPPGRAELVISHIGYLPINKELEISGKENLEFDWAMNPRQAKTSDVEIESKRSLAWRRRLARFKRGFLGESPFARKCELMNPEALRFTEKDGLLTAESAELLEVENHATGFKILFSLEGYRQKGELVSYNGKPFFQALIPKNIREASQWQKNRKIAYKGSPRHFYYSLVNDIFEEEGFSVYQVKKPQGSTSFERVRKIKPKAEPGIQSNVWKIPIEGFMEVVYGKELDWRLLGNSVGQSSGLSGGRGSIQRNQVSWLRAQKDFLRIDSIGNLYEQRYTKEYGFWAMERVAELLPRTFKVEIEKKVAGKKKHASKKGPRKNGFLLEPLLIGLDEIQPGGPPKDGIASIDRPRFVSVEKNNHVNDDDKVIGLIRNGVAKAYPIFIMERHEVVNDKFGEENILISYCPLCGSGMGFLIENQNEQVTFGVSGLLYNSNLLIYDRETESLWSQIMGRAISGPRMGDSLYYVPTTLTTWKQWRETYPSTQLLKQPINSLIDYRENPYGGYEDEQRLPFQVSGTSRTLPNKTRVLGIKIGDQAIAYAYSDLKKRKSSLTQTVNGVSFVIDYDPESESVRVSSPLIEEITIDHLYWFAWYAFHPETEVWNRKLRK